MSKIGMIEVHGFKYRFTYDCGHFRVYDCALPFSGFAPSLKEFEAKATSELAEQMAYDPYVIERVQNTSFH